MCVLQLWGMGFYTIRSRQLRVSFRSSVSSWISCLTGPPVIKRGMLKSTITEVNLSTFLNSVHVCFMYLELTVSHILHPWSGAYGTQGGRGGNVRECSRCASAHQIIYLTVVHVCKLYISKTDHVCICLKGYKPGVYHIWELKRTNGYNTYS